jgi:starch-binding outer membrane protein, SusD/RagB family
MKFNNNRSTFIVLATVVLLLSACHSVLDEPAENRSFTEETDYSNSDNIILPILGAYAAFNDMQWENFPLIAVRGDDVNAGGLGDQQDYAATDNFSYNKDYWMYNSVWQNLYKDIFTFYSTIEQVELYREAGASSMLADQYIAESKVLSAFCLLHLSRLWGSLLIPVSSDPSELLVAQLSSKDEVMQHIVDQIDEALPYLPESHPNKRTDIPGGVTKHTALAIKAMAELELKNYQGVADATSQIISSGVFTLEPDFYNLFKLKGKLNNENLLEMQFSDFGQGSGDAKTYLFAFFGTQDWTPAVKGAASGWGFFEPSLKYIKFMLDRDEQVRLETSVLFTNRGISEIESDPSYATLPSWISNTTREGDVMNDYARALFASGKHYLPSTMLTEGRTEYGTNKNLTCIRYAEVLLMHAEALTQGATSSAMSADDAVNAVRERAGLNKLSGVNTKQVRDEKFAELAMEWGIRFNDLVRTGEFNELNYDGRTSFDDNKIYLPYPQNQIDLLPALKGE